jgi:hypothetical protein
LSTKEEGTKILINTNFIDESNLGGLIKRSNQFFKNMYCGPTMCSKYVVIVFFFDIHHQLNLVQGLVLASGGSSPLAIVIAADRTVVLPTKFSANHH